MNPFAWLIKGLRKNKNKQTQRDNMSCVDNGIRVEDIVQKRAKQNKNSKEERYSSLSPPHDRQNKTNNQQEKSKQCE